MNNVIHFSNQTLKIIKRVFPSDCAINNKESNGAKLLNLICGLDFEELRNHVDVLKSTISFDDYDYSEDGDYQEVIFESVSESTIHGSTDILKNIPIKITTPYEYENGYPTRLEYIKPFIRTPNKIIGLEYTRVTPITGKLYMTLDQKLDNNTATVRMCNITNTGTTIDWGQLSDLGINQQSYEANGTDEVLQLIPANTLRLQYPLTRQVTLLNPNTKLYQTDTITHYTPDLGAVWNPTTETFIAITPKSEFYIDDSGIKIWYETARNNPYGYGNYDTIRVKLNKTPLSNTIKYFDMDNLLNDDLRELQNINDIYYHSGEYPGYDEYYSSYLGYSNIVPPALTPSNYGPVQLSTPSFKLTITKLANDSYYNDRNEFVLGSSIDTGEWLEITNSFSRIIVTYKYTDIETYKYITSLNATRYIRYDGQNIYSIKPKLDNLTPIKASLSLEPFTINNRIAATFDGLDIRPGSIIDALEVYSQISISKTQTSPMVSFIKTGTIIGSKLSNNILPLEYKPTHIMDLKSMWISWDVDAFGDPLVITLLDDNNDTYNSYIVQYNDTLTHLTLAYPYINLYPENLSLTRVFDMKFKYHYKPNNNIRLMSSCNSDSTYMWVVEIDIDGHLNFYDNTLHLTSVETIDVTNITNVLVSFNSDYSNNIDNSEYTCYATIDGVLIKLNMLFKLTDNLDKIDEPNICKYNINNSVDIYHISIYDMED